MNLRGCFFFQPVICSDQREEESDFSHSSMCQKPVQASAYECSWLWGSGMTYPELSDNTGGI